MRWESTESVQTFFKSEASERDGLNAQQGTKSVYVGHFIGPKHVLFTVSSLLTFVHCRQTVEYIFFPLILYYNITYIILSSPPAWPNS